MFISEFSDGYDKVKARLVDLADARFHPVGSNFSVDFDTARFLGDSKVVDIGYPNGSVLLGVRELYRQGLVDGSVSLDTFSSAISVAFHELRHIEQMADYQVGSNTTVSGMAMSRMVADANYDFYFRGHGLFNFEIDADYNGYLSTRRYLHGLFDDTPEVVDSFLVDLYNSGDLYSEVRIGTNIVAKSSDDLLLAFRLAQYMCSNVRKQYAVDSDWNYVLDKSGRTDRVKELEALKKSSDLFARTIAGPGSGFRWSKVRDAYLDSTSAEEVDKMVASVTLYLRPYYLDKFPVLKNLDLSPEAVFGFRFHESRRAVLQRLADIARFSGGSRIAGRGRDMCDIDAAMSNMSSESEFESEFDC